jgi:peroxiredoxin
MDIEHIGQPYRHGRRGANLSLDSEVGYNTSMRLKPLIFFAVVASLAGLAIYQEINGPGPTLQGSEAPDFELKNFEGETVHFSDFEGELVFLNFWATWCGPCIDELPAMMVMNQTFEGRPFKMLGISVDTNWDQVVSYLNEHGFELDTVLDPGQRVKQDYRVTGFPETFLIDGNGIVLKKYIGPYPWDDARMIAEVEQFLRTVESPPVTATPLGDDVASD